MSRTHPSKTEIIEHLQRLADGDKPPTTAEFDADREAPPSSTVYRLFSGGWKEAVREASLDVQAVEENHTEKISRQKIIDHIQRLADGDDPPTSIEFDDDPDAPARSTARKRFEGGWEDAVEAAGFDTSLANPTYSDADIIDHIQRLADGDTPPTQAELRVDPEAPAASRIRRRFEDGWKGAVKAAGFDVDGLSGRTGDTRNNASEYTQTEIIDHIKRLSEDGVSPRMQDLNNDPDAPSHPTVYDNFENGWIGAVKQAGLEPRQGKRPKEVSKEEIISHIQRLAEDGMPPTTTEFDARDDTPSLTTVRRKFDCGWPGIVEQAGFTDDF